MVVQQNQFQDRCIDCSQHSGHDTQLQYLKESNVVQWAKIDELAKAINLGKNWIIGILVGVSLNLITALITAGFIIAGGGKH